MKEIWNWIQAAFAAIGSALGWYFGGLDGFLYTLIAFVAVDYIAGVACAIADKKLSSEIGAKGIAKKVLIFALVGIGHLVDIQILGGGEVMRTAVIFFYLSNEGISILENAAHLGLPVPQKLKSILEQLHNKTDTTAQTEAEETDATATTKTKNTENAENKSDTSDTENSETKTDTDEK